MFEGSADEFEDRTWQLMNHILDETHDDSYISRDFYNVQQTAGGLPENVTFADFLGMVQGHIRIELTSSSFDEQLGDDDIRTVALAFDDNIRRHIRFLNGTVHQAAAGVVHLQLWDMILQARGDDASVYACYRDYLVDA
jgi:hypothetical protein